MPLSDGGYDIASFTEVNELFGTNEDMVELFAKAKELGLKIILDFVVKQIEILQQVSSEINFRSQITQVTFTTGLCCLQTELPAMKTFTSGEIAQWLVEFDNFQITGSPFSIREHGRITREGVSATCTSSSPPSQT